MTGWAYHVICRRFSPARRLFFFNDSATTEIYTLSLHDALPIWSRRTPAPYARPRPPSLRGARIPRARSEEHTSELQSRRDLVCRLLLEKKKEPRQSPQDHRHERIGDPAG